MQLTWNITKKRGNWRPVLTYKCVKDGWEDDLAVPGGRTHIRVPSPGSWPSANCMPGEHERSERFQMHESALELPMYTKTELTVKITLPWRPGAHPEYPEVEEAMGQLMAEWERQVLDALASSALTIEGTVEPSTEFKRQVAPYVAARRMLQNGGGAT